MDPSVLRPAIESLIFSSEFPLKIESIRDILEESDKKRIEGVLEELHREYQNPDHGFELVRVAEGYQFRTKSRYAEWIRRLRRTRAPRLSRSSMEVLAIIAYKQPIMRAEIEAIRGVDSVSVIRTLLERRLIRILGRKDVPGRPMVYGTTREFLQFFGLKNLSDLPTLREIEELHSEEPSPVNPQK
ncbi:MAG: SMC-Scp complex subunit ScpB [Proteobacteria bacterium]|nr:SMC-Scp complex subunit ScpB [Pseudomonadota bacterium]NIS68154.1 SMC-Scp complex subunit ScpB [Pseudomonadota bacterium]